MRVMLVAHGFPPQEQSGTERYTAELAQALVRAGHEVAVFAGAHTAEVEAHQWTHDGPVEIERLVRPRPRLRLQFHDQSVESGFVSALNQFGPDVVHVHHLLGLTMPLIGLAKERKIPVVVTLHDHWFMCPEVQPFAPGLHRLGGDRWGINCFLHLELLRPRRAASMLLSGELVTRLRRHVERARIARAELAAADIVIAPSRFLRDRLHTFVPHEARIFVLPHGVALPESVREESSDRARVGYLGPLLHAKGPDLLVRAFRGVRNPAATLELRGPMPDERFARRIRRLAVHDPRISIGPALAHADVGQFLAGLDLLVVPSRFQESFSLVAHEAFAARTPVLAVDSGALAELVAPGANGVLFRSGSVRDLRRRLRELLEMPGGLDELRSFPHVKSMDAHAGELAALYSALAAGRELPQPLARYARATARSVAS